MRYYCKSFQKLFIYLFVHLLVHFLSFFLCLFVCFVVNVSIFFLTGKLSFCLFIYLPVCLFCSKCIFNTSVAFPRNIHFYLTFYLEKNTLVEDKISLKSSYAMLFCFSDFTIDIYFN